MAVDERTRHELHTRAAEVLGAEHAETLMSMLPPVGWADVATRRDLDALQAATKQDLDALQAATQQDMAVLQAATQQDMAVLRAELRGEFGDLRGELHEALASHTRTLFIGLSGMMFTLATLTWAAISLT